MNMMRLILKLAKSKGLKIMDANITKTELVFKYYITKSGLIIGKIFIDDSGISLVKGLASINDIYYQTYHTMNSIIDAERFFNLIGDEVIDGRSIIKIDSSGDMFLSYFEYAATDNNSILNSDRHLFLSYLSYRPEVAAELRRLIIEFNDSMNS